MSQTPPDPSPEPAVSSGLKIGIAILSVFVPLVGIIMGLVFLFDKDKNPEKKAAGKLWLGIGGGVMALYLRCCAYFILVMMVAGSGGLQ